MTLLDRLSKIFFKTKLRTTLVVVFTVLAVLQYILFTTGLLSPYLKGFGIKPKHAELYQNERTKIIHSGIIPFYAKKNILYESSAPEIATVTDKGLVTGISKGVVVIWADLNGFSAKTQLTVMDNAIIEFGEGKYVGGVEEGKRYGYGIMHYANGNVYEGGWKDDTINGYGVMKWKNKSIYQGYWKDEQFNGFGRFESKDEYSYTGEWSMGQFEGFGKITWNNGNIYTGEWHEGQISGFGDFTWNSHDRYIGEWKEGSRNGFGEFASSRGRDKYIGFWSENLKSGYGAEYVRDILHYDGEWANNAYNGYGRLYGNNRIEFEGVFQNNQPIYR